MVFRILVKEKLILGDIWSLWTVFQKPKVVILDFKIACEINFCHLGVILVPKTFILNGIWSFPAVCQTPEVTILKFKIVSVINF